MSLQEADRVLADVAQKIRIFHHVNPVNEKEQKARFLDRPSTKTEPLFAYPPFDFSPEELLDRLADAPVSAIEDPRLSRLYEDRLKELVGIVRLLRARGTEGFLQRSLELIGRPPRNVVRDAVEILKRPRSEEGRKLEAEEVKGMLERHLDLYRERYPDFECQVVMVPHMSSTMYVHENRIHIKEGARFSWVAAECDRHHEIEAHIITYLNGLQQPLELLRVGLKGTMAFQESLGVFTEIASGVMAPERMIALCSRVVAVDWMVRGMGFFGVFSRLVDEHGFDQEFAYSVCQRVFRAGGFTKDWVYVAELEGILRYWAEGGELSHLLLGKVNLGAVKTVGELVEEGVIQAPRFLPFYLERIRRGRAKGLLSKKRVSLLEMFSLGISQTRRRTRG